MEQQGRAFDGQPLRQEGREGLSRMKARIQQLQLFLDLRTKQLEICKNQISQQKQEYAIKTGNLEQMIVRLQQECGELRVSTLKGRRSENERAEQIIKSIRNECQSMLQEQQQKHIKSYRLLQQKYREQVLRTQDKKQLPLQISSKDEMESVRQLRQQRLISAQMMVNRLQTQKIDLINAKRDIEQKVEHFKENYQNLRIQYEELLSSKDETITSIKAQLEGLHLKDKLLSEKLQKQNQAYSQLSNFKNGDFCRLQASNQKLQRENQQLNKILQSKNQQILQLLNNDSKISTSRFLTPQLPLCEHIGLISQLQRSLDLKQKQLREVKATLAEWASKIGFEEPMSARFSQLSGKAESTWRVKTGQSKALKDKSRELNKNKNVK